MDEEGISGDTKGQLENDVDALFKLPLPEFTGARNKLAAELKREGRADDSNIVKALAKPSISAWAVNQLYWKHREAFGRLLVTGQRFRQTSHTSERIADLRGSVEARREALSHLSDLASVLMRDAGHNPTPDTIHRVTTSLEALSAYAMLSAGPTPGRLIQDVEPPGFESLASLIPGTGTAELSNELTRFTPIHESSTAGTKTRQDLSSEGDVQKVQEPEETHQSRIAVAKVSLEEARRSLTEAQSRAQLLEAAKKKAYVEAKEADAEASKAEKQMREAEERLKTARAASQDAAERAQRIAAESEEAARAVEDARRSLETATKAISSIQM